MKKLVLCIAIGVVELVGTGCGAHNNASKEQVRQEVEKTAVPQEVVEIVTDVRFTERLDLRIDECESIINKMEEDVIPCVDNRHDRELYQAIVNAEKRALHALTIARSAVEGVKNGVVKNEDFLFSFAFTNQVNSLRYDENGEQYVEKDTMYKIFKEAGLDRYYNL